MMGGFRGAKVGRAFGRGKGLRTWEGGEVGRCGEGGIFI